MVDQSNYYLDAVLGAMPMSALLVGLDERVKSANPKALEQFGAGIVGRHYITVLRQPQLLDCIEAALRTDTAQEGRYLTTMGDRDIAFRVFVAPVRLGADGGVLVSFDDITDVETAGQMRRDFVANVSHELRTPLTAMTGFIQTLRGAARNDAAARDKFLGIMESEAARMNRLVDDLLSLSRVEANERMRPKELVDIKQLVESTVAAMNPLAKERGVVFEVVDAGAPCIVPGDADQLLQVFANLVENAVKYGASGGKVTVRLSVSEHEPTLRGGAVRVDVTDRGVGIDPGQIGRLTERFYRVDSHRSREMGGTGLGLAIVKHIVNRHRGRLRIESAKGEGSTFSVILPTT